jgi:hypothetical protein
VAFDHDVETPVVAQPLRRGVEVRLGIRRSSGSVPTSSLSAFGETKSVDGGDTFVSGMGAGFTAAA